MNAPQQCPKCGSNLRTRQVSLILSKYCDNCGSLPHATDTRTGRGVLVDRGGNPMPPKHGAAI